jgi:hypothetical protein
MCVLTLSRLARQPQSKMGQRSDDLAQSISALLDHTVVQRLPQLLLDWKQDDRTVLYILLALAVGFIIGRYRAPSFQNRGEALLSRVALTNFGPPVIIYAITRN